MYAPSEEDRYKIYIVDEAHMLTREAWNALLKILEEPPPRVIFVFATTEPQKIQQSASPILSRCQRFDFRRIGVSDIVSRLQTVLEREGQGAPEDALRLIARKADGGMRDGLSILDQVLALTGGEVDAEAVRRVLGLVEEERYVEVLDVLADGRHGEVFSLVESLLDDGYDLVEFYHGLMDALRAVLRLKLSPEAPLDLRDDVREGLAARAQRFSPGDLVRMLAAAAELESNGSLRRSANPRVLIEMLLLRMSYLDRTVELESLLRALGGAPPPDGSAGASGGGSGARAPGEPAVPRGKEGPDSTAEGPDGEGGSSSDEALPDGQPRLDLGASRSARRSAPGPRSPSPEAATPPPSAGEGATDAPSAPVTAEVETHSVDVAWARWLDGGKDVPRGMRAFLRSASVREHDGALEIEPPPGPALERLQEASVQDEIRRGLMPYLGRALPVRLALPGSSSEPPARIDREDVRADTLKSLYRKEPRLERAVQELDLELMD